MVDNFDQIKGFLDFPSDDVFYFLQIIKRKKDHPEQSKSIIPINTYHITSIDYFNRLEDEIISQCDLFNARAYISLNKKSFKRVGLETLKIITNYVVEEQYKSIKKSFNSACGKYSSDPNKKWVVDVDWSEFYPDLKRNTEKFNEKLIELNNDLINAQKETKKEPLLFKIKTNAGVHLITRPFNQKKIKDKYLNNIDIKKDNPTLLYMS